MRTGLVSADSGKAWCQKWNVVFCFPKCALLCCNPSCGTSREQQGAHGKQDHAMLPKIRELQHGLPSKALLVPTAAHGRAGLAPRAARPCCGKAKLRICVCLLLWCLTGSLQVSPPCPTHTGGWLRACGPCDI